MPCDLVYGPDGRLVAAFCSRGSRTAGPSCKCGRTAPYLCDYELKGAMEGRTCSRPLCTNCAVETAPDHHLCPAHARMAGKL